MAVRIFYFVLGAALFSLMFVNASSVGSLTTFTAGSPIKASEVNGNFSVIKTAVDDNATSIGTLSSLSTTNKNNLVSAINEVKSTTANLDGGGKISAAVLPATVALASDLNAYATKTDLNTAFANYGALDSDNTWTGTQNIMNAKIRLASDTATACDAGTMGQIRFMPATNTLQYCDGSSWLSASKRFAASGSVNNGQSLSLNLGGAFWHPQITVYLSVSGGYQVVTGNSNYPTIFSSDLSTITVTNNSGSTQTLQIVVDVH